MRKRWLTPAFVGIGAMLLMNLTCHVGTSPSGGSADLGVPTVIQIGEQFCTAACVLAWRLQNGLSNVGQTEIFYFMGGDPNTGVDQSRVPDGVNYYTYTSDAYLDFGSGGAYSDDQGRFLSRQITSVNANVPVIALTNSGLHAVVLSGGTWHTSSTTGYHVWDSINYMDPLFGSSTMSPGSLISTMCPYNYIPCRQVISASASGSGGSNYDSYGGSTEAGGIDSGGGGGGACPECKQY